MTFPAQWLGSTFNAGPAANLSASPVDITVHSLAKALVVAVHTPDTANAVVSGVDIEGNAASKAASANYGGGQGTPRVELWYLLDPPTGANVTVTVTTTGSVFADGFIVYQVLGPVDVTAIGATAAATYGGTASGTATVNLTTTVANSAIFYAVTVKTGNGAPFTESSTPGGEELGEVNRGDIDAWAGIIKNTGSTGSKTAQATMSSSNWAIAAMELKFSENADVGAVTRIGTTEQSIGNATNPSHNHSAPSGNNRLLVAHITHEDSTDPSNITGVTYGGQSMTQALENVVDPGTFTTTGEIWYLLESGIDAASGSSVAITFTGGNPDQGTVITTQFYRNVEQAAPSDTSGDGSTSNNGSGLTISIDELADGVVTGVAFHGASAGVTTSPPDPYREVEHDIDTGSQGHSHVSYDKLPTSEALNQSRLVTWASAQRVGMLWASWPAVAASGVPTLRGLETGVDYGATAARLDGALVA